MKTPHHMMIIDGNDKKSHKFSDSTLYIREICEETQLLYFNSFIVDDVLHATIETWKMSYLHN